MVPKVLYRSINIETLKKDMKYIKEKVLKEEYYISKRDKNELFRRKYRFTKKSDYGNILLKLNSSDFSKYDKEEQPDNYGEGIIYVFIKEWCLKNIHGDEENVNLYIKIKIPNEGEHLPVISFHVSEY